MTAWLHLHRLDEAPEATDGFTAAELSRLATLGHPRRQRQFRAGHALVRRLAAERIDGRAADWVLSVAADGRRRLRHPDGRALFASLSHAGDWVAVAVATEPVGIDLEWTGRPRNWLSLARGMFAPDEAAAVEAAPEAGREAAFLRIWTLKEAWSKRSGRGLQRSESMRCLALPAPDDAAEARLWTLPGGGTLAVAGAGGLPVVETSGVPAADRSSTWRFAAV